MSVFLLATQMKIANASVSPAVTSLLGCKCGCDGAMTLKVEDPLLVLTTLNEEWANKMKIDLEFQFEALK